MGTCNNAVGAVHLVVLQWVRDNGCPWDRRLSLMVMPAGSETREWILAHPA